MSVEIEDISKTLEAHYQNINSTYNTAIGEESYCQKSGNSKSLILTLSR